MQIGGLAYLAVDYTPPAVIYAELATGWPALVGIG
jgi:hypothetical protein